MARSFKHPSEDAVFLIESHAAYGTSYRDMAAYRVARAYLELLAKINEGGAQ